MGLHNNYTKKRTKGKERSGEESCCESTHWPICKAIETQVEGIVENEAGIKGALHMTAASPYLTQPNPSCPTWRSNRRQEVTIHPVFHSFLFCTNWSHSESPGFCANLGHAAYQTVTRRTQTNTVRLHIYTCSSRELHVVELGQKSGAWRKFMLT